MLEAESIPSKLGQRKFTYLAPRSETTAGPHVVGGDYHAINHGRFPLVSTLFLDAEKPPKEIEQLGFELAQVQASLQTVLN